VQSKVVGAPAIPRVVAEWQGKARNPAHDFPPLCRKPLQRRIIPSKYRASHCNVALSQANTGQAVATSHYPKQILGKPLQRCNGLN
jgi:hypothetical protein